MPITKYIWDPVSDNVLMETDENDVTTAVYTHEPGEFGRLISQRRGNKTSYYHYDAQGSTRALTDSTQTVTDTYIHTAFGESVATTGTTINPFRYVGERGYYFDPEIEDYYVRERIYQPTMARWTAVDPLSLLLTALQYYKYAHNNPNSFNDPSGEKPCTDSLTCCSQFWGLPEAERRCRNWDCCESKVDKGWLKAIANCPCQLNISGGKPVKPNTGIWYDPGPASQKFHPGACWCMRQIPLLPKVKRINCGTHYLIPGVFGPPCYCEHPCELLPPPAQQCCYDSKGKLITEGPGAGTPDVVGPTGITAIDFHLNVDVQPYISCKKAGLFDLYLKNRPPNNGKNCNSNNGSANPYKASVCK